MPVINGTALGVSIMDGYSGYPTPATYTSIKVYGGAIIDHVHIKNVIMSETDISNLQLYVAPTWDGNTIFLANFENTLNGGNITGLVNPITNWKVLRRKTTETSFATLATLPSTSTSYIDATAEPNVTYIYQVLATNATEISEPLQNTLESNFFNCLLCNLDGTIAFIFDLELDFSGLQENVAFQIYEGYNKYPTISVGDRRYKTGEVSAILADSYGNGEIVQTVEYIKMFTDFIGNGQPKIFKDRKGNVLKVMTTGGVKQDPFDIRIGTQPYRVWFQFTEIGEVNG